MLNLPYYYQDKKMINLLTLWKIETAGRIDTDLLGDEDIDNDQEDDEDLENNPELLVRI